VSRVKVTARFSSDKLRRLAERALVGTLEGRGRRALARHLEWSDQDREAYHRLARLFCAMEGLSRPEAPTLARTQHQRILEAVQQQVAAAEKPRGPGLLVREALALALLALIVVAGLLWIDLPTPAPDTGFQVRSSAATMTGPGRGLVGLKAFCIDRRVEYGPRGKVVPPPRTGSAGLGRAPDASCRLGDELQLTVTHTGSALPYLIVIGLDGEGRRLWYFPVPPTGRSGSAPRDVVDEPLGEAIRLSVNHRPGEVRILAVFSRSPLPAARVFSWLGTLDRGDSAEELIDWLAATEGDPNAQAAASTMTAAELHVKIEGGAR
jgi:hypothetical protein